MAAGCSAFACGGTVRTGATGDGDGGPPGYGVSGGGGQAGRSPGGLGGTAGKGGIGGIGAGGTKMCPPPLTRCGSSCVDLQSDTGNCGTCNSTCFSGASCVGGACQISGSGGSSCGGGLTYCSNYSECLDLQSNPFACGSCNNFCLGKEACIKGICAPGTCFSGLTACGNGVCSNTSADPANCGACGNQCGPAESCTQGQCVQPDCGGAPYTFCQNSGCTDVSSDIANCGGCGKGCAGDSVFDYSAYTCTNGTCGCAPLANSCGAGCASQFWYCPPSGSSGSAADFCTQTARNAYERCACKNCLDAVMACGKDPSCVNAMDCSLVSICVGCPQTFPSCSNQQGATNPLADTLLSCMNAACAAP